MNIMSLGDIDTKNEETTDTAIYLQLLGKKLGKNGARFRIFIFQDLWRSS
jgi:hypothetical protein